MIRDRGFDRDARRQALLEQLGRVGPTKAPVAPPIEEYIRRGGITGGGAVPSGPIRPTTSLGTRPTVTQPTLTSKYGTTPSTSSYGYKPEVKATTYSEPEQTQPRPSQDVSGAYMATPQQARRSITAPAPPPVAPTAPVAPGAEPLEGYAEEQQKKIDDYRKRNGLPPVVRPTEAAPGTTPPPTGAPGQPPPQTTLNPPGEVAGALPQGWEEVEGRKMPSDWGPYAKAGSMEGYGTHGGPSSYGEPGSANPHFGTQYQVSRILSHIDPGDPDSFDQAHQAFLDAGLQHEWDGFDRFDFGNGWIDLKHNKEFVKSGGKSGVNVWTWLEQGGGGGAGAGGTGETTAGLAGATDMNQLMSLFGAGGGATGQAGGAFGNFMAGLDEFEQSELIKQLLGGFAPGTFGKPKATTQVATRNTHTGGSIEGGARQ